MTTGTEDYYARRAREYDRVYEKPERQGDIGRLSDFVVDSVSGRRVLDVAAGTGFWTARYADRTEAVALVDVNAPPLEVARERRRWPVATTFHECDAFHLDRIPGRWDAAFVGFFWSHVPQERLDLFLDKLMARVEPNAVVVFADNAYVEGSNHAVTRADAAGNTYQRRRLGDGSEWEVLKNFPSAEDVRARLERFGLPELLRLRYYWAARVVTTDG